MKNLKNKIKNFITSEKGDVSVKGIAIMVAIIIIVGAATTFITGSFLGESIEDVWEMAIDAIQSYIG